MVFSESLRLYSLTRTWIHRVVSPFGCLFHAPYDPRSSSSSSFSFSLLPRQVRRPCGSPGVAVHPCKAITRAPPHSTNGETRCHGLQADASRKLPVCFACSFRRVCMVSRRVTSRRNGVSARVVAGQDNWEVHKEAFTPDQLSELSELLVSPHYYA